MARAKTSTATKDSTAHLGFEAGFYTSTESCPVKSSRWHGTSAEKEQPQVEPPKGNTNVTWPRLASGFIHCIRRSLGDWGHLVPEGTAGFVLAMAHQHHASDMKEAPSSYDISIKP